MRTTYVYRWGRMVEKRMLNEPPPAPSGPYVISDKMYGGKLEGLRHPSTGRFYDSKSRFRAESRARGLTASSSRRRGW